MDLWGLFQENGNLLMHRISLLLSFSLMIYWLYIKIALTKLKEANDGRPIDAIVWTSEMTSHAREFLSPDDYIIQIWSKGKFFPRFRIFKLSD